MKRWILSINAFFILMGFMPEGAARAGDLNPPAGPVAPTHKTLTEVQPRIAVNATNTPADVNSAFRITQPGSYYMTGNLTGANAKNGVKIAASGVTLDLMGFEIIGVASSLDGVTVTGAQRNIAVVNGSIRNWGADGVDLGTAVGTRMSDLQVSGNVGRGINAARNAVVTRSTSYLNTGIGIEGGDLGAMTECAAQQNGGGVSVGTTWTIRLCSASGNTGDGFSTGTGGTLAGCTASGNTDDGFTVGNGNTLVDCTAQGNGDVGILATTGCTIQRCNATENTTDGIEVGSSCRVMENNCQGNGAGAGSGAGVHVTGSGNRIEANNAAFNDRGIEFGFAGNNVAGTDNIVIKNSVTGGPGGVPGNYLFHPLGIQNTYGEILNFTAGGQVDETNSHPWANFEY